MRSRAMLLGLGVMLAGCGSDTETATGTLTLDEELGAARGSFVDGSDAALGAVGFESRFVDTNVLEIVIDMNGMLVTALVDFDSGIMEYDGFALENGEDTQMLDEDRALLVAFAHALDELGSEVSEPVRNLRRFVSTWSEFPTILEMQRLAMMDEDRDITSICYAYGTYMGATHDCCRGFLCSNSQDDRWDDETTNDYAYMAMNAAGTCSDGTYFWNGSSWQCYEPDHRGDREYAYGNCFGRCGGGCGADTQFTVHCRDHDQCVRNGHPTAGGDCDVDEFPSTVDDWASAPDCL